MLCVFKKTEKKEQKSWHLKRKFDAFDDENLVTMRSGCIVVTKFYLDFLVTTNLVTSQIMQVLSLNCHYQDSSCPLFVALKSYQKLIFCLNFHFHFIRGYAKRILHLFYSFVSVGLSFCTCGIYVIFCF